MLPPCRLTSSMSAWRSHTSVALQPEHVTCTCASMRWRSRRFFGGPTMAPHAFRRSAQTSEDRLLTSAAAASSRDGSRCMVRLLPGRRYSDPDYVGQNKNRTTARVLTIRMAARGCTGILAGTVRCLRGSDMDRLVSVLSAGYESAIAGIDAAARPRVPRTTTRLRGCASPSRLNDLGAKLAPPTCHHTCPGLPLLRPFSLSGSQ